MSEGSSARVERRSLDDDAFRVVSARDSLLTRLRNLWNRRELLSSLIRSDIRIKYKNSALGIVWSMLTPTLFLAIYWLVFAKFLKNGIPNFVIYLFAGMVVWNMFNTSLSTATGVIVVRAGLVKKVSFPREILALANVGAATFLLLHSGLRPRALPIGRGPFAPTTRTSGSYRSPSSRCTSSQPRSPLSCRRSPSTCATWSTSSSSSSSCGSSCRQSSTRTSTPSHRSCTPTDWRGSTS